MNIEIVEANLDDARQVAGIVDVIDAYAREPAGGSEPIPDAVRARLLSDLRNVDNAIVLVALDESRSIVGVAVCFRGYSTFKAQPLLNIHDLAVMPANRGQGIGHALLNAAENRARADGCCKLTLEVLDDNYGALRLYENIGFGDGGPGSGETTTLFMQKPL